MITRNIRIGFIVSEDEYESTCQYFNSLFNNKITRVDKHSEYCFIDTECCLIRIFKYKEEWDKFSFSIIIKSGRYSLFIISTHVSVPENELQKIQALCCLPSVTYKNLDFIKNE